MPMRKLKAKPTVTEKRLDLPKPKRWQTPMGKG